MFDNFFNKIKDIWTKWGYEILLGICILFILLYAISRKGKSGTWSNNYTYIKPTKPAPPTESKGERECRRVLQYLFKKPFDKERPEFLRNPVTGNIHNLELDCYNKELNLAVEYSGVQHYKYVPYFHKNKEAFLNQKYRDELKRINCKQNGVNLIEVPYTVKIDEIQNYLLIELRKLGYI